MQPGRLWESGRVRRRGAVLVVAVLVLAACGSRPAQIVGFGYTPYAHQGEPFAKALFAEQARLHNQNDPTLGFVSPDIDDTYTHVNDLARRSWTPPHPTVTVWFFGGSALFGIGQRDEHTIPSEVARLAHADGVEVRAVNYGLSAYVRWQEEGLYRRLVKTHRPPDLVVFYDGINDYTLACRAVEKGLRPEGRTLVSLTNPVANCPPGAVDVAAGQLEAPRLNVPVAVFYQPDAFTQDPTPPKLATKLVMPAEATERRRSLEKAIPAEAGIVDLTAVFDGAREPLFFDYAHTNEAGARIVAEAMWAKLKPLLGGEEVGGGHT